MRGEWWGDSSPTFPATPDGFPATFRPPSYPVRSVGHPHDVSSHFHFLPHLSISPKNGGDVALRDWSRWLHPIRPLPGLGFVRMCGGRRHPWPKPDWSSKMKKRFSASWDSCGPSHPPLPPWRLGLWQKGRASSGSERNCGSPNPSPLKIVILLVKAIGG